MLKKAAYWGSVVVIGITLGFSLQLVKAWTEPTVAPPGGNLGAPINTSGTDQTKTGTIYAGDVCLESDHSKCLSDLSGATGTFSDLGYQICCKGDGTTCAVAKFGDIADPGSTEWSGDANESGRCTIQMMDISGKCIHDGVLYNPGTSYTEVGACVPVTCNACFWGTKWCSVRQKPTTIFTCQTDEDFDGGVAGPVLPCSAGFVSC